MKSQQTLPAKSKTGNTENREQAPPDNGRPDNTEAGLKEVS